MKPHALIAAAIALIATAQTTLADDCAGAKLKGLGKLEAGYLRCHSTAAHTGDASKLAACRTKAAGKFAGAFAKAGACSGDQPVCEATAAACEDALGGALTDILPSDCTSSKWKAAGKLAAARVSCYAKSARAQSAVQAACLDKAGSKFADAMAKAGSCADGGSFEALVETSCVASAVTVDGGDVATQACPLPTTTTTTTTTTSTTTSTSTTTTLPCTVTPSLLPVGGLRLPQTLTLDASASDACGAPLSFTWDCSSATSADCPVFLAAANTPPYGNAITPLTVNELDEFDIGLTVCVRDTTNCAARIARAYSAPSFSP